MTPVLGRAALSGRTVWLTDRYGAQQDGATIARLSALLDTIAAGASDDGVEMKRRRPG